MSLLNSEPESPATSMRSPKPEPESPATSVHSPNSSPESPTTGMPEEDFDLTVSRLSAQLNALFMKKIAKHESESRKIKEKLKDQEIKIKQLQVRLDIQDNDSQENENQRMREWGELRDKNAKQQQELSKLKAEHKTKWKSLSQKYSATKRLHRRKYESELVCYKLEQKQMYREEIHRIDAEFITQSQVVQASSDYQKALRRKEICDRNLRKLEEDLNNNYEELEYHVQQASGTQ
ncbi:hypothetical protein KEM56_007629 [Ascosphaera pollenicola]|nr:hypothetical protein KEM56_007629 [Ascosphaera pollenicola]